MFYSNTLSKNLHKMTEEGLTHDQNPRPLKYEAAVVMTTPWHSVSNFHNFFKVLTWLKCFFHCFLHTLCKFHVLWAVGPLDAPHNIIINHLKLVPLSVTTPSTDHTAYHLFSKAVNCAVTVNSFTKQHKVPKENLVLRYTNQEEKW
jgi:hypothetical protein